MSTGWGWCFWPENRKRKEEKKEQLNFGMGTREVKGKRWRRAIEHLVYITLSTKIERSAMLENSALGHLYLTS